LQEAAGDDWRDAPGVLRRLGDRLPAVSGVPGAAKSRAAGYDDPAASDAPRRRSLLGAAALAGLALAAAYATWALVGRPQLPLPKPVPDTIDVR
jgi:hypothetical protein